MVFIKNRKTVEQKSVRRADPCIIVIFGASGDLTKRKLIPALYNLASSNLLPDEFAVVGVARHSNSTAEFRQSMSQDFQEFAPANHDPKLWAWLESRIYYLSGEFATPDTYSKLKGFLAEIDQKHQTQGNYLYYLATAPRFFSEIIAQLGNVGLATEANEQWRRVVIEKPFGHDLASAQQLNRQITSVLKECQIYRIDHYLGKETVQNILMFRFGNGMFEPIWNHRYIDHVQITVAETVGVGSRGGYYETSGALRDMVQNHLFQLLAMVAMEPPVSFDANAVRDEKAKVMHAIEPMTPADVLNYAVRGQYGAGMVGEKSVPGYRTEGGINPNSNTETFAAMKLSIDNWRWANVPFYLRTGKRMAERVSEIAIQFKQPPSLLFRDTPVEQLTSNFLVLRIQPNEGITMQFGAKIPGPTMEMGTVGMNFCYSDYFNSNPTTGYETLIYDCAIGDATLFQRSDNVELGWSVVKPMLDVWQNLPHGNFPNYEAGSWGPIEADQLLTREGRKWREIDPTFCGMG
ncbi:MAG: glucose-6-phosphate dehydrogenase [Cyanobacteria bacterium P01_A01_bin.40]